MSAEQFNQLLAAVQTAIDGNNNHGTPSVGTTTGSVMTPRIISSSNIKPTGNWTGFDTNEEKSAFDKAVVKPPDNWKPISTTQNYKVTLDTLHLKQFCYNVSRLIAEGQDLRQRIIANGELCDESTYLTAMFKALQTGNCKLFNEKVRHDELNWIMGREGFTDPDKILQEYQQLYLHLRAAGNVIPLATGNSFPKTLRQNPNISTANSSRYSTRSLLELPGKRMEQHFSNLSSQFQ